MKILRVFGLIGLVIYTIMLMMSCGREPGSDSTSNEYLKVISTISSSVINALKGTTTPTLAHIKSPSLQEKNLVSYGFRSSKAGTINYSGGCFSSTRNAIAGDHHILFVTMVEGKYDNCAIQVTDSEGNTSEPLQVPSFMVDFSVPELSQIGEFRIQGRNVEIGIKASEAGDLIYSGNCSGDLQHVNQGKSELTINFPGDGQYSDCELTLIDSSGNTSEPLPLGTVRIDATPPVLAEIKPVPKMIHTNRPSYSFKTSKSGTLRFSGKCRGNVDKAVVGINHIALLTAEPGVYDDCKMTLTDSSNNQSKPLKISPFVVVGGQS
jgi:hypothetical protein